MSASKQESLSRQFTEYIGNANLKNPGEPTKVEQFYIQRELVESCCASEEQKGTLRWPRQKTGNPPTSIFNSQPPTVQSQGNLPTEKKQNPSSETYVYRYQRENSCDSHAAVNALASLYHITSKELFGIIPGEQSVAKRHIFTQKSFSQSLGMNFKPLESLNINEIIYKRNSTPIDFIASPEGLHFEVLRYFAADRTGAEIQIPLHISNVNGIGTKKEHYELNYGVGKGRLPLYNLNFLDGPSLASSATVLLCEDLTIAVILSAIIMDSKRLGQNQYKATDLYVATGWYGGTRLVECVDFMPLWNKKIVFIPAISRNSYINTVENVMKHCHAAEVKEFRIYRRAVLKVPPNHENYSSLDEIGDPWERHLAKNAVSLKDCETQIVKTMAETAVTWDEYKNWGEKMGIFTPSDDNTTLKSGASNTYTHTVSQLRAKFSLEPGAGIGLDCFGTFENMTVLYGRRFSSKTMLALAVAVGRACGQGFLGFKAMPAARVLYVDGETSGKTFRQYFERTLSAFRCNEEQVKTNFYTALLYADHQLSNIDLEDESQQKEIISLIRRYKPELIIFDNLRSLLSGFRSNNATETWKVFHQWLLELEKIYQTGFLILHHDNAEGGPAGTEKIASQCGTEIYIMGKDWLKNELKKQGHSPDLELYRPYLDEPGALFRAEIKKTKFYSSTETSAFGGYLNLPNPTAPSNNQRRISGLPWQQIGHVIPARNREYSVENEKILSDEIKAKYPGRTEDEYRILEFLHKNERIKIKDICLLLGNGKGMSCSKSTALKRIAPLKDEKIVDLIKAARNSYYQFREVSEVTEPS